MIMLNGTTTRRLRTGLATGAVAALGVGVLVGVPADAAGAGSGDREVIRHGSCSGPANWKLKAKSDNGRIEVEGEVDSDANGQRWRWRILHEGDVAARGRATTSRPSGSFEVTRRLVNAPGDDRIGWRARHVGSGHTCRGGLTF